MFVVRSCSVRDDCRVYTSVVDFGTDRTHHLPTGLSRYYIYTPFRPKVEQKTVTSVIKQEAEIYGTETALQGGSV